MNKELFNSLCDRLKNQVPELRYIDFDFGQLDAADRPPVALPCCLIRISYPSNTPEACGVQITDVQISIRVAFETTGQTNAAAPEGVRKKALQLFDTLDKMHAALSGYCPEPLTDGMVRSSATDEGVKNDIKLFTLIYTGRCQVYI